MFSIKSVKGLSCPTKYLVCKNEKPLLFCNSKTRASMVVQYLEGYITEERFLELNHDNKKVLKLLKGAKDDKTL